MTSSRRTLLAGLGAAAVGAALPRPARAASPSQRRFLFLTCFGGWDPTRVLVPAFDDDAVDMEPDASPLTVGNLTFVDHRNRPGTRTVLNRWGSRFSLVHGFMVPSVAHMACLQLVRTGALSGHPDWPAILASATTGDEPLPHLVVSGPSYPDALSPFVARTGAGGQLEALIDGSIVEWTGRAPPTVPAEVRAREDALVASRRAHVAARATATRHAALLAGHEAAEARVRALQSAASGISWGSTGSFEDDALLAVELLAAGICRCASVGHPTLWDSHSQNDVYQNALWEPTMMALGNILETMEATPGPAGGSLLDETVVVLLSEMGRTPVLNSTSGKDHWPYASALLVGAGVAEGGSAGAYDPGLLGAAVEPTSGEPSASGEVLTTADLGATLLALGDVDPAEWMPTGNVLESILA